MTAYIVSFAAGLLIGVIYHFMGVRSPAPPLIALLGLLGILVGESGIFMLKEKYFPKEVTRESQR